MTSTAADPARNEPGTRPLVVAAVIGGLGVALGAFGAHALKTALHGTVDGEQRLAWWDTATRYQIWHALLCGLLALRAERTAARVGVALVVVGVVLFSGSLYAMTLTNLRVLGAITPLGGLAFLGAWTCLGLAMRRAPGQPSGHPPR
jgi:uncharacterized membrane protein YgdD (TMEM256/DUF423 family)